MGNSDAITTPNTVLGYSLAKGLRISRTPPEGNLYSEETGLWHIDFFLADEHDRIVFCRHDGWARNEFHVVVKRYLTDRQYGRDIGKGPESERATLVTNHPRPTNELIQFYRENGVAHYLLTGLKEHVTRLRRQFPKGRHDVHF